MNIQLHDSTDINDQILENYVALFRHAIGDRQLRVIRVGVRFPKKFEPRIALCADCGQEFMKRATHHKFCGSAPEKTGCAHKRAVVDRKKYWVKVGMEKYKFNGK